ncbi:MAG: DUF4124 domain-containing protein [Candidatus Nitrotoga sp.]
MNNTKEILNKLMLLTAQQTHQAQNKILAVPGELVEKLIQRFSKLTEANLLGVGLILLSLCSTSAQAKLFKWVDDNGTTHYGETIPPEYANKDNVLLNTQGRVTKRNEKISEDERRAQEEGAVKKRIAENVAAEQRRKDISLLNTYSSEQEIELARVRNLQQIEARTNSLQVMKKSAEANLKNFQTEAENKTKSKKVIPDSLRQDIVESQDRLDKINRDLAATQEKYATLNTTYNETKKRFRELTGVKK